MDDEHDIEQRTEDQDDDDLVMDTAKFAPNGAIGHAHDVVHKDRDCRQGQHAERDCVDAVDGDEEGQDGEGHLQGCRDNEVDGPALVVEFGVVVDGTQHDDHNGDDGADAEQPEEDLADFLARLENGVDPEELVGEGGEQIQGRDKPVVLPAEQLELKEAAERHDDGRDVPDFHDEAQGVEPIAEARIDGHGDGHQRDHQDDDGVEDKVQEADAFGLCQGGVHWALPESDTRIDGEHELQWSRDPQRGEQTHGDLVVSPVPSPINQGKADNAQHQSKG